MNYRVSISKQAYQDLDNIYNYICNDGNYKLIAKNILNQLFNTIFDLEVFPERYAIIDLEPFKKYFVRMIPVSGLLILYVVDKEENTVKILRVINEKMDINRISFLFEESTKYEDKNK